MKKYVIATAIGLLMSGAAQAGTIGVTMANSDTFLTVLRNAIVSAAKEKNQSLSVEIAEDDVGKQISQIQNFIAAKVDAIIVNATDTSATPKMTALAAAAGVPLVYVNRQPSDVDKLGSKAAFIASNEVDSGTLETKEVCKMLGGKGDILVIVGDLANQAAIQRTKDIHDVIATSECKGMKIIDEQTAGWDPVKAQDLMTNWISAGHKPAAVISNNDNMAIGAIQAMKAAKWDLNKVIVSGIDATQEGLASMKAGDLKVTVFQNGVGQGRGALDLAMALASGKTVEKKTYVPFELVTPANMSKFLAAN